MQFFHETHINFVGVRKYFIWGSSIITVFGLILVLALGFTNKIDYGIDFTGGSEIALKYNKEVHTDQVRAMLSKLGIQSEEVKSFGADNQFLIRIKETTSETSSLKDRLEKAGAPGEITVLKIDTIGPKIGGELRNQAILAVILSLIAILIYISFRFEFIYGMGAVIAMLHDVMFTLTITILVHKAGLINLEINQSILAAFLTVVGYSINDTVIIFDRIRENKEKHKGMHFIKMVNLSINETLSRTVNTVMTVFLVLLTMVLFAGPVLQGFAFVMLIGILIGTYSSVYIASSTVIFYLEKIKKTLTEEDPEDKKPIPAKV